MRYLLGVGDDAHSWAADGQRQMKWFNTEGSIGSGEPFGSKWKKGDVIGIAADLSTKTLSGALMVDASFKGANLTEVVMSKAYALNADFTGADFTNAVVPDASTDAVADAVSEASADATPDTNTEADPNDSTETGPDAFPDAVLKVSQQRLEKTVFEKE